MYDDHPSSSPKPMSEGAATNQNIEVQMDALARAANDRANFHRAELGYWERAGRAANAALETLAQGTEAKAPSPSAGW